MNVLVATLALMATIPSPLSFRQVTQATPVPVSSPAISATPLPAIPAPIATPVMLPDATAPAGTTSLPVAVPSAAPPSALRVDRARVGIAPGTSFVENVSGATGLVTVTLPYDGVDASYDPATRRLTINARTAGSGAIVLTDRSGATATIALLVAPLAGTIPADVSVDLAGTVSQAFATARVRGAIDRAIQRRPGTALDVHGITIPATLAPGDTLEAQAGVTLDGHGTYVDVAARTSVHLRVVPEPPLVPTVLFYSDDPEYINAQADGVLFHGTIDVNTPARIFVYHVARDVPRRIALVLGPSAAGAHVQVLGTIGGPSPAYPYVGQQSTARFLATRAAQESTLLTLAPGVPYELPLGVLQPNDLLEALQDIRVLDGGPLDITLVTTAPDAPLPALAQPELPDDSHQRRGAYALTDIAPIALAFTAGTPEPQPVSVGATAYPNLRPSGRALAGDYGIVRPVVLTLSNPGAAPQDVFLYELTSGGGGATATFFFNGDTAATLIPCIDDPANPHLVKAFTLAAGETRTVSGSFMTDGASTYPVRFGLTATAPPPVPPGACSSTHAP